MEFECKDQNFRRSAGNYWPRLKCVAHSRGFRTSGYYKVFRRFAINNRVNPAKVDTLGFER
jgi:hypothetical protein